MKTPRLRPELRATPAEEEGIKFFDVSDPHGGEMRLYDFEWLIAQKLDGHRALDEIASFAKHELQLDISEATLAEYCTKLGELGFFGDGANTKPGLAGNETPLPPPRPGVDTQSDEELELEDDPVTMRQDALPAREPAVSKPEPVAPTETDFSDVDPDTETLVGASDEQTTSTYAAAPRVEVTPAVVAAPMAEAVVPARLTQPRTIPQSAFEDEVPKKSGMGSIVGLLFVILVVAAVVYYVMFMSAGGAAKVSIVVAKPAEVLRTYDASGKVDKAEPKILSFGEAGKVVDVVAAGTEVKEGMPLATLDGYTKVEKEIADVKDRLGFYQKQLDAATAKGGDSQKSAEGKVNEKKKLLGELEAKAAKLRLVAQGPGVVEKVHVTAGGDAKADAPAVELNDKRVVVVFKLAADATAKLKTGDEVALQKTGGGTATGKISKIDDGAVTVDVGEELPPDAPLKLVKARLAGVVALPLTAVAKKNGGDVVYVLADGAVHEHKVTVADRTAGEAYVSTGISAGDMVVTAGAATLTNGQKASSEP